MLKQILLVGLGGGAGSILRYLASVVTQKYTPRSFPLTMFSANILATYAVNIIGCFLIGLFIGVFSQNIQMNQNLKFLFITGFCGGYTTFSTFAFENLTLIQNNHWGMAFLYMGLSLFTGLFAVWVGLALTR